jgi:hypothetical protein
LFGTPLFSHAQTPPPISAMMKNGINHHSALDRVRSSFALVNGDRPPVPS